MGDRRLFYVANVRLPTEKAHGLQIMKSCEAFAKAGWDVLLIVPARANPLRDDPFEYYGISRRFGIRRVPIMDTWRLGHVGFLLINVQFAFRTRLLAKTFGIGRDSFVYGRDPLALSLLAGVSKKVFLELHDLTGRLERFLCRRASRFAGFVTTNRWKKERLVADVGIPESRILVAPNGVSLEDFDRPLDRDDIRKSMRLGANDVGALYVGRFYAWKGVKTLIAAAALLPANIRVVCIGGVQEEGRKLAGAAADRVTFIPNVPHGKVADYLRAADVLVLPNSASTQESVYATSPIKAFEYMASGTPIVASDLPSIREILSDDIAAFCSPDRPDTLAETIRRVLELPDGGRQMGERAREHARAFSWDRRALNILKWIGGFL